MNDVISIALASTDDKYINGLLPSLKSAFGDKVLFVPGNESLKKSKSELNFNLINFWSPTAGRRTDGAYGTAQSLPRVPGIRQKIRADSRTGHDAETERVHGTPLRIPVQPADG